MRGICGWMSGYAGTRRQGHKDPSYSGEIRRGKGETNMLQTIRGHCCTFALCLDSSFHRFPLPRRRPSVPGGETCFSPRWRKSCYVVLQFPVSGAHGPANMAWSCMRCCAARDKWPCMRNFELHSASHLNLDKNLQPRIRTLQIAILSL